jgi:hypothetical protein
MNKKISAAVALAAVVSVAGVSAADAASKNAKKSTATTIANKPTIGGAAAGQGRDGFGDGPHGMGGFGGGLAANPELTSVLTSLVTAKTITQAQSDAIVAALKAADAAHTPPAGLPGNGNGQGMPGFGGRMFGANDQQTILSYLGITAAQLQTSLQTNKTLAAVAATITGKSAAGLITALVTAETAEVQAAVTAGKLSTAQQSTIVAGLQAQVTARVNGTGGFGGFGGRGMHGFGGAAPLPGASTTATPSN